MWQDYNQSCRSSSGTWGVEILFASLGYKFLQWKSVKRSEDPDGVDVVQKSMCSLWSLMGWWAHGMCRR